MTCTKSRLEKVTNNPSYGLFRGTHHSFFYDRTNFYKDHVYEELVVKMGLEEVIRLGTEFSLTTPIELFE